MKYISLAWNWLVLSSTNENKLSTTVKGSLAFTLITALASVLHISGIQDATDSVVAFVVETSKFVSVVVTVIGAFRKIRRTTNGTNAVLQP